MQSARRPATPEADLEKALDSGARTRALLGIGLGFLDLLVPHRMVRHEKGAAAASVGITRLSGAHKVAVGVGLLTARNRQRWLIAGMFGGALDAMAVADRRQRMQTFVRVATFAAVDQMLLAMSEAKRINQEGISPPRAKSLLH